MKIVLLANAEQKEEMITQKAHLPAEVVWIDELASLNHITNADGYIDLLFDDSSERMEKLKRLKSEIIIINSVVYPLNELTSGCVRINGWNTFLRRPVVEAAGDTGREITGNILSLFEKRPDWVADIGGFISARVVAAVINEAYFALEQKVSSKKEIDIAMKLGTNYPYGPFEWCEKIGAGNVYSLLKNLSKEQKRYEPAPLLAKEANS